MVIDHWSWMSGPEYALRAQLERLLLPRCSRRRRQHEEDRLFFYTTTKKGLNMLLNSRDYTRTHLHDLISEFSCFSFVTFVPIDYSARLNCFLFIFFVKFTFPSLMHVTLRMRHVIFMPDSMTQQMRQPSLSVINCGQLWSRKLQLLSHARFFCFDFQDQEWWRDNNGVTILVDDIPCCHWYEL